MENFVTPLLNLGFALALSLLVGLERCLLYTSDAADE